MNILGILIPVSLFLGGIGLAAFFWALKNQSVRRPAGRCEPHPDQGLGRPSEALTGALPWRGAASETGRLTGEIMRLPDIVLLTAAVAIVGSNSLALSPIAVSVAADFPGAGAADVMMASALFGAGTALSALTLAPAVDRIGLSRALVLALAVLAAAMAVTALAPGAGRVRGGADRGRAGHRRGAARDLWAGDRKGAARAGECLSGPGADRLDAEHGIRRLGRRRC